MVSKETPLWYQKTTIPQYLRRMAEMYPDRLAITDGSDSRTYSEMVEACESFARSLLDRGVRRGDRIALLMSPSVEWAIVHYGIIFSGALSCPINTMYKEGELRDVIVHLNPVGVISDEEVGGQPVRRRLDGVVQVPNGANGDVGVRPFDLAPEFLWLSGTCEAESGVWESLNSQVVGPEGIDLPRLDPNDNCCIVHTTGTTGRAKPALLRHNVLLGASWMYGAGMGVESSDRLLVPWPVYHVSGVTGGMLVGHMRGASVWVMPAYDPKTALEIIESSRISAFSGFDTTFTTMARAQSSQGRDVSSMRRILLATRAAMYDRVFDMFPNLEVASKMHAMTEMGGPSTVVRGDEVDYEVRKYSHGKPVPGLSVRIADPDSGDDCDIGEYGEIRLRGWNVLEEYFGMEEATNQAFDPAGWFMTGDEGRLDNDGNLYFTGRFKQIIKSGGENVSEREIETFLEDEFPVILLAQVVGVPDDVWGEAVTAFVEVTEGASIDIEDIVNRCKELLADFKVPKQVHLLNSSEWPRNEVGKISKTDLVALAEGNL